MTNGMNQEAINQEASGTEAEGIGESVPEVGGAEATETVTEATEQDANTSVSYTIPSTTPPAGPTTTPPQQGRAGLRVKAEKPLPRLVRKSPPSRQ